MELYDGMTGPNALGSGNEENAGLELGKVAEMNYHVVLIEEGRKPSASLRAKLSQAFDGRSALSNI